MTASHLSCAIALQAALESEQDASRLLRDRIRELEYTLERIRLENEEIRARNDALEAGNAQLQSNIRALSEHGWRKDPGDLDHD